MTPTEVASLLDGLSLACQQQMYAEDNFRRELQSILTRLQEDGLVVRLRVDADRGAGFQAIADYGGPAGDERDALGNNYHTVGSYRYTIEGWSHREGDSFDSQRSRETYQTTLQSFVSILSEHWGKRDTMTLLPRLQDSGQQQRLYKAIRDASLDGSPITAVHLDLDHFKQVNTEFGEPGGDAVLREFGDRIRSAFGGDSIAVRKGGEEFSLFFPRIGLSSVLPRVEHFRQFMAGTSFAHISRPNTCSMGIACFPSYIREASLAKGPAEALLDESMIAERRAKNDGRNCIRLAGAVSTNQGNETQLLTRDDLVEAALWARRDLSPHDTPCFGTELHSFLAEYLIDRFKQATGAQLESVLASALQTFGISVVMSHSALDDTTANAGPYIHAAKLASIVAHALLRLAMSGTGPLGRDDKLYMTVAERGGKAKSIAIVIRRTGIEVGYISIREMAPGQADLEVYAGKVWSPRDKNQGGVPRWVPQTKGTSLSPVLLLAIGQPSLELQLQPWVAAVVEVDDRPVSGGGLPDFWQSNISRVIHATLNNPNIERILVIGDESKAARTLEVLGNRPDYPPSRLAKRLSIDIEAIEAFRQRNLTVSRAPAKKTIALEAIEKAYFVDEDALTAASEARDLRRERLLQRRMPTSGFSTDTNLLNSDGIRCTTLAEAYPRIIHLLRSSSATEQCDHMSRRFWEVTGFKLVLETPLVEPIPYYWLQEEATLNEYVEKQFVQSDGLFSQALKGTGEMQNSKDQYRAAVLAALHAINNRVASRRIIMIAGNPQGDWQSPLGLVCVHLVPRIMSNRWTLHFQWVWRTVEALVGLPFSVYGSIRQSESILQRVNAERPDQVPIEMGEVTYFALSLHMFLDEGDKDIARTIVVDAYE